MVETPRGIFCPDWFLVLDACSPGPAQTWSSGKGPACRGVSSASWGPAAEAKASLGPGVAWAEVRATQLRKDISWLPAGPGFCAQTGLVPSVGWLGCHSYSWRLWAAGASPQPSRQPVRTLPGSLDKQPLRHDSQGQGSLLLYFSHGAGICRNVDPEVSDPPAPGHVSSHKPQAPSAPEQRL